MAQMGSMGTRSKSSIHPRPISGPLPTSIGMVKGNTARNSCISNVTDGNCTLRFNPVTTMEILNNIKAMKSATPKYQTRVPNSVQNKKSSSSIKYGDKKINYSNLPQHRDVVRVKKGLQLPPVTKIQITQCEMNVTMATPVGVTGNKRLSRASYGDGRRKSRISGITNIQESPANVLNKSKVVTKLNMNDKENLSGQANITTPPQEHLFKIPYSKNISLPPIPGTPNSDLSFIQTEKEINDMIEKEAKEATKETSTPLLKKKKSIHEFFWTPGEEREIIKMESFDSSDSVMGSLITSSDSEQELVSKCEDVNNMKEKLDISYKMLRQVKNDIFQLEKMLRSRKRTLANISTLIKLEMNNMDTFKAEKKTKK